MAKTKRVPSRKVIFTWGENHGNNKKGESSEMHVTTAEALVKHNKGEITKKLMRTVPA